MFVKIIIVSKVQSVMQLILKKSYIQHFFPSSFLNKLYYNSTKSMDRQISHKHLSKQCSVKNTYFSNRFTRYVKEKYERQKSKKCLLVENKTKKGLVIVQETLACEKFQLWTPLTPFVMDSETLFQKRKLIIDLASVSS